MCSVVVLGGLGDGLVLLEEGVEDGVPGAVEGVLSGVLAHLLSTGGVVDEEVEFLGEVGG